MKYTSDKHGYNVRLKWNKQQNSDTWRRKKNKQKKKADND